MPRSLSNGYFQGMAWSDKPVLHGRGAGCAVSGSDERSDADVWVEKQLRGGDDPGVRFTGWILAVPRGPAWLLMQGAPICHGPHSGDDTAARR